MNPFMLKIDQSMHSMDFKTQNLQQKACEEMVAIQILVSLRFPRPFDSGTKGLM